MTLPKTVPYTTQADLESAFSTTAPDLFASAPSLRFSAGYESLPGADLGAYRPGGSWGEGGLSFEQLSSLSDLRRISDYEIPKTTLTLNDAMAALPGRSGGVRTGSFDINMLNLGASLEKLTGETIGREDPLAGTVGAQDPLSAFALGFLNDYGTMPGKLLDYALAVPVTWMSAAIGANGQATTPRQVDGSYIYSFQSTPEYWNLLRSAATDEDLRAVAEQTAAAQVSPALRPALAEQLYGIFRQDRDAATGMSSGNNRIDYLAKMNLQAQLAMGKASGGKNVGLGNLLNPFDGAFLTMWDEGAKMALRGALSFLPFLGTDIAGAIDPVRAETEAAWSALTPEQRTGLAFNAQMQTIGYDLPLSIPLFNGVGTLIGITKAGAAGASFADWRAAQASMNVASDAALAAMRVGAHTPDFLARGAFEAGKIGFNVPEVVSASRLWGMGEVAARLARPGGSLAFAGRWSLVPDSYEAIMAGARLMMGAGIAAWSANYAAKSMFPGYSETLGRQIDESHWVSESSLAAVVDNVGLMAGGGFGAGALWRATKGAAGWTGELVGLRHSPMNPVFESHMGEVASNQVAESFGQPAGTVEMPFKRMAYSFLLRKALDELGQTAMRIWRSDATTGQAKAETFLADNAENIAPMAEKIAAAIKAGHTGELGGAFRRFARQAADELAQYMESEHGVSRWGQRLEGHGLAYTPEGFTAWIRHTASFLGWDPAGVDVLAAKVGKAGGVIGKGARAQMEPWRKVGNNIAQQAFDHFNGVLKAIVDSGTSDEAAKLLIMRRDHLFKDMIAPFKAAYEAGNEEVATVLKDQLMRTIELRDWWATKREGRYGEPTLGAREVTAATTKDVYNYVRQIELALPTRRALPGEHSQPGELNDLHLLLEQHGDWTLAFKPEEPSAIALRRIQWEQALAAADEWGRQEETLRQAFEQSDVANAEVRRRVSDVYFRKYVDPIDAKYRDEVSALNQAESDAITARETALERWRQRGLNYSDAWKKRNVQALDKKVDAARQAIRDMQDRTSPEYDAAYKKAETATKRNAEVKASQKAYDEAQRAYEDFRKNPEPRLGYHVGPVAPRGFVWDPTSPDMDALDAHVAEYAKAATDAGGPVGLFHATVHMSSVQEHGLLNKAQMAEYGLPGTAGTGGGAREYESSTTVSFMHAQAWADRFRMMARIVSGRAGLEDVFTEFAQRYGKDWEGNGRLDEGNRILGYNRTIAPTAMDDPEFVIGLVDDYNGGISNRYGFWKSGVDDLITEKLNTYRRALERLRNDDLSTYEIFDANGGFQGFRDPLSNALGTMQAFGEDIAKYDKARPVATGIEGFRRFIGQQMHELNGEQAAAMQGRVPPTPAEAFAWLANELRVNTPAWIKNQLQGAPPDEVDARIAALILQRLDDRLPEIRGGKVLITGDPWRKFSGRLNEDDIGIVRVAVNAKDGHGIYVGNDDWGGEVALRSTHTFTYQALPEQPFADPIHAPSFNWPAEAYRTRPISYLTVRDPVTGEQAIFKAPFLEYPTSGVDFLDISNRSLLARKFDDVFRAFRSWRITQYQQGQLFRLVSSRYEVTPEQIDALHAAVSRIGWEKWSPVGRHLRLPMGMQAAGVIRNNEVNAAAARIFGKVETGTFDVHGNPVYAPAAVKLRGSAATEVPDWADIVAEAYRQAWSISLTSALTSKLYTLGDAGRLAMLSASWLTPTIRYVLSPVFKLSEVWESKGFNWMRATKELKPDEVRPYTAAGLEPEGIAKELRSGEVMGEVIALSQGQAPAADAGLAAVPGGFAITAALRARAREAVGDTSLGTKLRQAWATVTNPTPMKDRLQMDMAVQTIGREFADIVRIGDPAAYRWYRQTLKVPDAELARYIVKDRELYQRWMDGSGTFSELMDHATVYRPEYKDTAAIESFYKSPEWQATEAMFRIAAKSAQAEAYSVHFFGAYRSAFERSINHPLLGVYPASWAYKAAREWFKFLFDNHTFGGGELSLGAVPAAYLQSVMQAQTRAWAMGGNQEPLEKWLNDGPLGNALFIFNLLMPGDWSNIPFPASRSIRMALRGEYDPIQHLIANLVGPRGQGGIGAIRDANMLRLVGGDIYNAFLDSKADTAWGQIVEGVAKGDANAPKPPGWDDATKFPTPFQMPSWPTTAPAQVPTVYEPVR